jgi:hypothetical protein
MFFSPNPFPAGLTDNEVAICIRLCPWRRQMIKRYNEIEDAKLAAFDLPSIPPPTFTDALELVEAGVHDTIEEASEHLDDAWAVLEHLTHHPMRILTLPSELTPSTEMTRERFRRGIRAFIAQYRIYILGA